MRSTVVQLLSIFQLKKASLKKQWSTSQSLNHNNKGPTYVITQFPKTNNHVLKLGDDCLTGRSIQQGSRENKFGHFQSS